MRKVCYHEHYVKCFYIGLDIWYPLTHAMQDSKLKFMVPFLDLLFYLFEGILCLLSQRKSEFKSLLKEWYFHSLLDTLQPTDARARIFQNLKSGKKVNFTSQT